MSKPTDVEHSIALEALEQLGKNRPGRTWLRDNVALWEENARLYEDSAKKLRENAQKARSILIAHNAVKAESHEAEQAENREGGEPK